MKLAKIIASGACLVSAIRYVFMSWNTKIGEDSKEAQYMTAAAYMLCLAILLTNDI